MCYIDFIKELNELLNLEAVLYDMLYLAVICQANYAEESDSCLNGVCPKHHSRTISFLTRMDEGPATVTLLMKTQKPGSFSLAATHCCKNTRKKTKGNLISRTYI